MFLHNILCKMFRNTVKIFHKSRRKFLEVIKILTFENLEKNLGDYLRKERVNLSEVARETGIAYELLYNSLMNRSRNREIRGKELLAVCSFFGC